MGKMKSVLIICLVLGLFLGKASANFKSCYRWCYIPCILLPRRTSFYCSVNCVNKCLPPSSHSLNDTLSFCELGCAYSLCTNLSSKDDPGEEKVAGCVDSCKRTCTKRMQQAF
ncbi:hypothetical protein ACJRO7_005797 [Eucalyptus globulus]|uniref:Thionin-like protein 2 n=1 Tax=Eucalyptus globulus TaxID=34317 RepID=A0ABD3J3B7_EUCGL